MCSQEMNHMTQKRRQVRPRAVRKRLSTATKKRLSKLRLNPKVTGKQYKILEYMFVHGGDQEQGNFSSAATIGRALGMTANAVRCHRRRMRINGLLEYRDGTIYCDGIPTCWVNVQEACGEGETAQAGSENSGAAPCQTDTHNASLLTQRTPTPCGTEPTKGEAPAGQASPIPEVPVTVPRRECVPTPASSIPERVRRRDWRQILASTSEYYIVSRFFPKIPDRLCRRLGSAIRAGRINEFKLQRAWEAETKPVSGGCVQLISYLQNPKLSRKDRQQLEYDIDEVNQQISDIENSITSRADMNPDYWPNVVQMIGNMVSGCFDVGRTPLGCAGSYPPWMVCYTLQLVGLGLMGWTLEEKNQLALNLIDDEFGCKMLMAVGFTPETSLNLTWEKIAWLRGHKLNALRRQHARLAALQTVAA